MIYTKKCFSGLFFLEIMYTSAFFIDICEKKRYDNRVTLYRTFVTRHCNMVFRREIHYDNDEYGSITCCKQTIK